MKRVFVSLFVFGSSFMSVTGCGEVVADQVSDQATATADTTPPPVPPTVSGCVVGTDPNDMDCDGFGKSKPDGKPLDCNDGNAAAHPSISDYEVAEVCNGLDDDCNGQTDEGFTRVKVYRDADGDGYGDSALPQDICEGAKPPVGYVAQGGDCNDADKEIHPGGEDKTLDGTDQNCNDVDGSTPTTPAQPPAPAAKPGTLTATATKADRLELNYQLLKAYDEMGKSWSTDEPVVEDWADETNGFSVTASIPDTQYACGLRVGLTLGGGSGKKWACSGGQASDLLKSVELKIGDTTMTLADSVIWIDPAGGCGLYFAWGEACAAPKK